MTVVDAVGKVLLIEGVVFLIWSIATLIIMLVLAKKSSKRGQVVMVFVVMSIIMLVLAIIAYASSNAITTLVGA